MSQNEQGFKDHETLNAWGFSKVAQVYRMWKHLLNPPSSENTLTTNPPYQRISQLWKAVNNNVGTDNFDWYKTLRYIWQIMFMLYGCRTVVVVVWGNWRGCCSETLFEALHSFVLANPNERWIIAAQTVIRCLWFLQSKRISIAKEGQHIALERLSISNANIM